MEKLTDPTFAAKGPGEKYLSDMAVGQTMLYTCGLCGGPHPVTGCWNFKQINKAAKDNFDATVAWGSFKAREAFLWRKSNNMYAGKKRTFEMEDFHEQRAGVELYPTMEDIARRSIKRMKFADNYQQQILKPQMYPTSQMQPAFSFQPQQHPFSHQMSQQKAFAPQTYKQSFFSKPANGFNQNIKRNQSAQNLDPYLVDLEGDFTVAIGNSRSEISVTSSFKRDEERLKEVQKAKEHQTGRLEELEYQMKGKAKSMEADYEKELQKLKEGLDNGEFTLDYVQNQEHLLFLERQDLYSLIDQERETLAQEIQFFNNQEEDIVNMLEAREEARGNQKPQEIRQSPQKMHMGDVGE